MTPRSGKVIYTVLTEFYVPWGESHSTGQLRFRTRQIDVKMVGHYADEKSPKLSVDAYFK